MQKTDLTTIDKESEPNLYRFCEWANKEIDNGMVDVKFSTVGAEERAFAHFLGEPIPEGPKFTRDEIARDILEMISAPRVPHSPGLF